MRAALLLVAAVVAAACAEEPPRQAVPDALRDLPVIVPAAQPDSGTVLALVLTGDGGWAAFDRELAARLTGHGVAVVGLNMRRYLERARTPEETAQAAARVLGYYLPRMHRTRIALIGWSRGADAAPFVARRLPHELRARLALVAMYGLAPAAGFHFHWIDLLRDVKRPTDLPVKPELEALRGMPMLCVYGRDDAHSGCRGADTTLMTVIARPGGHHMDDDWDALAAPVLRRLGEVR